MSKRRIGIFAGTFDPIHAGHLAFALQALKEAKLDKVYFLPERRPRHKPDVEHFGHRTAMITRAIRPYRQLALLELPDIYFDIKRTLPKLQREFGVAELSFLMGSDTALRMGEWPEAATLLQSSGIIIGLRDGDTKQEIRNALMTLSRPARLHILPAPANHISSRHIRRAVRRGLSSPGLLMSVRRYAHEHWLYVSLAGE